MRLRGALGWALAPGLLATLACGHKTADNTIRLKATVVARALLPNVMMLIGRSGLMATNTSTAPPCPSTLGGCGPGSPCPAGCATRMSELQAAMNQFLPAHGAAARFGLSVFPKDSACGPTGPSEVLVALPAASPTDDLAALQALASDVNGQIATLAPSGGGPVADSLIFVADQPELTDPDRQNFVLLVTDGAPNCNGGNPNTCADPVSCQCTTPACTTTNGFCTLGCLDADGPVGAVNQLALRNVKTIVIAVGADLSNTHVTDALDRMGQAGGFVRTCPQGTDSECGPSDTCDTVSRVCHSHFFPAANATELTKVLGQIVGPKLGASPVCVMTLRERPADVSHLTVLVNGQAQAGCATAVGCDTWTLDLSSGAAVVSFHGATCSQLQSSTPQMPVDVEFDITP